MLRLPHVSRNREGVEVRHQPTSKLRHRGAAVAHSAALTTGSRAPTAGSSRCPAGSGPDRGLRSRRRARVPAPPRTRVGETARRATGRRHSPHRQETAPSGLRRSLTLLCIRTRAGRGIRVLCQLLTPRFTQGGCAARATRRARHDGSWRRGSAFAPTAAAQHLEPRSTPHSPFVDPPVCWEIMSVPPPHARSCLARGTTSGLRLDASFAIRRG
jgi:hypothetical protein